MSNPLIEDRDRFAALLPEERVTINGREWGTVAAGDQGPSLVLLPGTLGRADIFWQQIEALKGRARILALSYPANGGVAEWAGASALKSASVTDTVTYSVVALAPVDPW